MSSRFTVVNAPARQPGHCWITKTSVGPFIDTGIDLSLDRIDRGRIYLSIDVLREMAQTAGLFDEKEPVTVELKRKQWYNEGYEAAIKEMSQDVINRFTGHISHNVVGVSGNAAMVAPEGNYASFGAAIAGAEGTATGASESFEDVGGSELEGASVSSSERPVGVSTDSSDDDQYRL